MKCITETRNYFICGLLLLLIAAACKGPETTVVRQAPTTAPPDTTEAEAPETEQTSAAFRQINIGENSPIVTLDPLFADNASTMRALQLVHEGLVRYDENGNVVPGLARSWEVSSDSLSYRFSLRSNIYYHDSDAFSNGVGRRVVASDVKFAFERMATLQVPDDAARLFMDIRGFEPFYREQHKVYNPSQRVLGGIGGIEIPNDTTIVFNLVKKDKRFLQKLASPYAVIYPREAITNNNPARFKAAGTGPFTLSQQRGDSVYVFSKFDEYYNSSQPVVNRVDVMVKKRETDLFRSFAGGDIHLLPELGLQTMEGVLDSTASLNTNYRNRFSLVKPGGKTNFRLRLNQAADQIQQKASLAAALFDSTDSFNGLPPELFNFRSYIADTVDASRFSSGDTLSISNTRDPFSREFILLLRDKLNQQGATLQVYDIYTPTREIGLYTTHHMTFYEGEQLHTDPSALVEFSVPHMALYRSEIPDIFFNQWPWWIDLRNVTVTLNDSQ